MHIRPYYERWARLFDIGCWFFNNAWSAFLARSGRWIKNKSIEAGGHTGCWDGMANSAKRVVYKLDLILNVYYYYSSYLNI